MRKVLFIILIVVCFLFVALYSLLQAFSRDAAPPDYSEFAFTRPVLDPASNAWTLVAAAIEQLDASDDDRQALHDYWRGNPVDEDLIADILARNRGVFDLVEAAVQLDAYEPPLVENWSDPIDPPPHEIIFLSRLFGARVRRHQQSGETTRSVDGCITLLRLGGLITDSPNSLLEMLVGQALIDMGIRDVQMLARNEALAPGESARLIATVQALDRLNAGWERVLKAEAVRLPTALNDVVTDYPHARALRVLMAVAPRYLLHPHRTEATLLAHYRAMLRDVPRTYADMERGWLDLDDDKFDGWTSYLKPNYIGRMVLQYMSPTHSLLTGKCRTEAALRGTVLIVALRAHEQRTGALPLELAELVPELLAAVPLDPFDGEPFRYCRERGIVYSVGINLTDFGGTRPESTRTRSRTYQEPGRMDDIVFDLRPGE